MARRNWKTVYPSSLLSAMQLCTEYALAKHNLSIDRIADLMGLHSSSTLYKYLGSGRMPAVLIRSFEHVCGIDYVTQFLAHSHNKLILDIPTGRKAKHRDLPALNKGMSETMLIMQSYCDGDSTADEAIASITLLMEGLALQRGNITKEQQPELELAQQ